ncbi:N-acetylmuramoyl-L-alanine amidase AmiA precursor [Prosthecochloris sp. CIB 2401]|nr:N-acetylmuramoyl-L-alanine amidase AmiA precursor [Prosthecochloris sp. CIB 2401]
MRLWTLCCMFAVLMCLFPFRSGAAPGPVEGVTSVELHAVTGFQQGYTVRVAVRDAQRGREVDMSSLASSLRLVRHESGPVLGLEDPSERQAGSCSITAGGHFALITPVSDAQGRTAERLVQLASAPAVREGRLFLPLDTALRLLSAWMDRDFNYDPARGRITAFLWSSRPGSQLSEIGIMKEGDRFIGVAGGSQQQTRLSGLQVDELANGVVIRINASGRESVASFIKPDAEGKAYLTFQHATGDPSLFFRAFSRGLLKEVNAVRLDGGGMQVGLVFNTALFSLKSTQYRWDRKTNSYVVAVLTDVDVQAVYQAEKEKAIMRGLLHDQAKWNFDTIVLDAGHGGKDPGAIGPGGTQEKGVVLNIAKDLGAIIRREWPGVRVVYTRSDDTFIPLKERGTIANRHNAKLFVSIHCNAARSRAAKGAEVYILGPHKNEDALQVAMLENAVIRQEEGYEERYKGFSEEHMILSSLAQSAFTLQSTEAARHVLEGMEEKTSINGRGVRQAGFMVLWTPSMPSILVEAGYLSNPQEERKLKKRSVQRAIAEGIFNGLKQYRNSYEQQQLAAKEQ